MFREDIQVFEAYERDVQRDVERKERDSTKPIDAVLMPRSLRGEHVLRKLHVVMQSFGIISMADEFSEKFGAFTTLFGVCVALVTPNEIAVGGAFEKSGDRWSVKDSLRFPVRDEKDRVRACSYILASERAERIMNQKTMCRR